ncbi:MAG: hypothetical protein MUF44_05440 [Hydrogenophaga sp.]|nr:hypothetical protein [Hydrogenophaga sp.]
MIRITISVLAILSMVALLWIGYSLPKDQRLLQGLLLIALAGLVIATIYFDFVDSIGNTMMGSVCALATIWSGWKMIESIDFDKPFLLSFYWSTLGFLLLSLFCLLLSIGAFANAAGKKEW